MIETIYFQNIPLVVTRKHVIGLGHESPWQS